MLLQRRLAVKPARLTRETSRRRRGINRVDQLADTSESAAKRRKTQPRQLSKLRFVSFFWKPTTLHNFAGPHDVCELVVQIRQGFPRQGTIEATHESLPHPACRMKDFIELCHAPIPNQFSYALVQRRFDRLLRL